MRKLFVIALLSCALYPRAASSDCTFGFLSPVEYPAGAKLANMVAGDFNNDGYADLAVMNRQSSNISILRGTANGQFAEATTVSSGFSADADIAAAHIDSDSNLDLLVNGGVQVLIGDGSGGFTAGDSEPIGSTPWAIAPADFDNDGDTDFAVTRWGPNPASMHHIINLGGGNIAQTSINNVIDDATVGSLAWDVAAGDFDGDGKLDAAVTDGYNDRVVLFFGLGDGTFTRSAIFVDTTTSAGVEPSVIRAADFNGDGYADLAVGNHDPYGHGSVTMAIALSNGASRTFAAPVQYGAMFGTGSYDIAVTDIDGDGELDVIVVGASVYVFRGVGDGTFNAQQAFGGIEMSRLGLGVLDVDRDGGNDLAVSNFSGEVEIFQNTCGVPTITLISSANPAYKGTSFTITASLTANLPITGTMTLAQTGSGTLGTTNLSESMSVASTMSLELGSYEFTATYSGDSRFRSKTVALTQTVTVAPFGPPPAFNAISYGGPAQLSWAPTSGTAHYEVFRDLGSGFAPIGTAASTTYTDSTVPANSAALYKVRAVSPGDVASAFSATDATTTHDYTDPAIIAGITIIKQAHLTELRSAAIALRDVAGLPLATWTSSTTVKASQVNELRTAINAARTALALNAHSFTDNTITEQVTVVRAVHFEELRAAMR